MILCHKCRKRPVYAENIGGVRGKYCRDCLFQAIASLPNPECDYCWGTGQYLWHSDDCDNEDCVLAAGYDDCKGQMVDCDCSILDSIEVEK